MNRTFLAAPVAVLALAGCATVVPPVGAAAPYQTPAGSPAPVVTVTPDAGGPLCQAFLTGLAHMQQTAADGTATLGTYLKFGRGTRAEAALAAGDEPLAADLATAARVVIRAGRAIAAGKNPHTAAMGDALENVKIDCGQP